MSMKHKHRPVQPSDRGKVQQNFSKDADINVQLARHMAGPMRLSRIGNPNATAQPRFLDLASGESYHDMLNRVSAIDEQFRRLPARLRSRFQNRPELLLNWLADPENTAEAVKLRLIADPEVIRTVLEAQADEEARQAGEPPKALKADEEAQPPYTTPKGGTPPKGG